jgi:hypothetical protein
MNSSTSASDDASEAPRWRRLLCRYATITLTAGLALGILVLALDPYDTGRFSLLPAYGVADFGPRLASASIGRRRDVDAAIFGNSTVQLLDPARLSRMSGYTVVSLAVPGTGPMEQLALAAFFHRHHRAGPALVFGIDASWCATDDPIKLAYPFPLWLYSEDRFDYVVNMMRYKSFEAVVRRLKLLAGYERMARPDGYRDYDTGKPWHQPEFREPAAPEKPAGTPAAATNDLTAPPLLRQFLAGLHPDARVVLVFPPRHTRAIPPPGSVAAAELDVCNEAYRAVAGARPDTQLLDFLVDGPMARRGENFWDAIHYRAPVAREIEDRLADALKR